MKVYVSLKFFYTLTIKSSLVGLRKHLYFSTGLIYDERLSRHHNVWNEEFSEVPDRVVEPLKVCTNYNLIERCKRIQCREASVEEMLLKHSQGLVDKLAGTQGLSDEELKEMSRNYDFIYFHPLIYENARLALGGTLDLVRSVLKKEVRNGMAIIRPPGHHAMNSMFCGYCYLNNVASAAQVALDEFELKRILIVDWDVHHGQGTQYMFYDDPRVLYFSIHTYDYGREWPNLRESDYDFTGSGPGAGYNINVPLNTAGCGNEEYMAIFQQILLPVAYAFSPELVLVSAGYDSAIGCPEGRMEVTPAMFAHFVSLLSTFADGKICLIQEGGYCIKSLAEGIALSLRALLGDPTPCVEPFRKGHPNNSTVETILNVIKVLRPFWKCLQFQDFLESEEELEGSTLMSLPPKPGIKFYSDKMPTTFDLFAPCYDEDYENVKDTLYARIDSLIRDTDLTVASNKVCIVSDDRMLLHRDLSSSNFEESDQRLSVCLDRLKSQGLWQSCHVLKGREATEEELALVHKPEYIQLLSKLTSLSDETVIKYQETFRSLYLCQETYQASSVAVGSLLNCVDSVISGTSQSGVAVIRPPGHHAEPNNGLGFCIFNNVGIAGKYIRQKYPYKKILIVDWDLHHGNGIQDLFYNDTSVLYISLHRYDYGEYFPGGKAGSHINTGGTDGQGHNVNIAWNHGSRCDGDYISAFQQVVLPVAYQFGPDIVLVAAGFDACIGDTLGTYQLTPQCFGHLTKMLKTLANGKIILSLEGGYDGESMAGCLCECVSVLHGNSVQSLGHTIPSHKGIADIKKVLDVHKQHWSCLKFREKIPTTAQLGNLKNIDNSN